MGIGQYELHIDRVGVAVGEVGERSDSKAD